jgi:hypothetical protein
MNIDPPARTTLRSRTLSAVAVVLVIAAGLALRARMIPLSAFVIKYGGDALWALMVFCGVGFLLRRASTVRVGLIAICFSCAVEFSQLYHAPWIDAVRGTRLGALAIGSTFNWPDFLAYGVGVGVGMMLERAIFLVAGLGSRRIQESRKSYPPT